MRSIHYLVLKLLQNNINSGFSQGTYHALPQSFYNTLLSSDSRMAQTTQWLQAIRSCMRKVRMKYQRCMAMLSSDNIINSVCIAKVGIFSFLDMTMI